MLFNHQRIDVTPPPTRKTDQPKRTRWRLRRWLAEGAPVACLNTGHTRTHTHIHIHSPVGFSAASTAAGTDLRMTRKLMPTERPRPCGRDRFERTARHTITLAVGSHPRGRNTVSLPVGFGRMRAKRRSDSGRRTRPTDRPAGTPMALGGRSPRLRWMAMPNGTNDAQRKTSGMQ